MNDNFSKQSPEERTVPLNKQPQLKPQPPINKMNDILTQQSNRPIQSAPHISQNPPILNYQINHPVQTATQKTSTPATPIMTPIMTPIRPIIQQPPVQPPKIPVVQSIPSKNQNISSPPLIKPKRSRLKLESVAYYIFLATIFLTPLVFLPTPYISLGLVKTIVIVVGMLASAICYGIIILKEKSIALPTKTVFWSSILVIASLLASAFLSNQVGKALFGQGFEVSTVGFLITLFIAAWVAFESVRRDHSRILAIFKVLALVYIILALLELLRLVFGPTALSLSILTNTTSTLLGSWYDFGTLSLLALIVSVCALITLALTRRMKIVYGIIAIAALFMAFIVNQTIAWFGATFAFVIIAIALYRARPFQPELGKWKSRLARIAWLPTILCIIALILVWKGNTIAGPVIQDTKTQYSELSLPWQVTTDIIAGTIKNYPLFGVGPNHFTQAYTVFKPLAINTSNAWNVEFSAGFGLIPTFIVTQGSVGAVLWVLLFISIGILLTRSFKKLPSDPQVKFIALSSGAATILLFINIILYVPSHAVLLIAFIIFGIFLATVVHTKTVSPLVINPISKIGKLALSFSLIAAIILGIIYGFIYVKKFMAFTYFASGVKSINVNQDFKTADIAFKKALSLDNSDVYLQALSENARLNASQLISSITSAPSEEITATIGNLLNDGIKTARQAIAYDPTNYYNYVSEARISDLAASIKMTDAYENSVRAYTNAINLNPLNPSLYVNLAQSQARNNKFDDALRTIGVALQVKNNNIDAVYLLSQIQVAQGNLKDAIISTQVATQMSPQSPLLFFQLGLLQYNAKNYASSTEALERALTLTPEYANAKYFLGLSYVRVNRIADAIAIFTDLAKTNPDNKEISFILTNLEAGKSPFADAKPPVTSTPEKRATLPVKEKKQ